MSDDKFLSGWQRFGIPWLGGCAMALSACASGDMSLGAESAAPALHAADEGCGCGGVTAILRNALGTEIGRVTFAPQGDVTLVEVSAELPDVPSGIRGMHIHANDNPENGEGCIADPTQPASTHFASADGHYTSHAGAHGEHSGDLPALFVTHSGEASSRFITDRFDAEELVGRVVILHEAADNYGNIPVGEAPDQYTPNDVVATDLTARTGNAGARYACGLIESGAAASSM